MYASRETIKKKNELAEVLKETLVEAGFEVREADFGGKVFVGPLEIRIDTRQKKNGYSHELVVKWEYGGYPATKKWTKCVCKGTQWSLPKNAVARTRELLAEAEADKARREAGYKKKNQERAEANERKEQSAQVVHALREELGLAKDGYDLSLFFHNGASVTDTSKDPAKVQFKFEGVVSPETAKKLLAILGE